MRSSSFMRLQTSFDEESIFTIIFVFKRDLIYIVTIAKNVWIEESQSRGEDVIFQAL